MVQYANLGPVDLTVVFVVALLVFGPKRLPEIGKQVGTALRDLRKLSNEFVGVMTGVREEGANLGQTVRGAISDSEPVLYNSYSDVSGMAVDNPEPVSTEMEPRRRGLSLSALPPEAPREEEVTK
jgi:sec-independent protein translocase protein TatA